jgi:hypothetical protein
MGRRGSSISRAAWCFHGVDPLGQEPSHLQTRFAVVPCLEEQGSFLRVLLKACVGNPGVVQFFVASKKDLWVPFSHCAPACSGESHRAWNSSLPPPMSERRVGDPWGPFSSNARMVLYPGHFSISRHLVAWLEVPRAQQPPLLQSHLCHRPWVVGGPKRSPLSPLLPVSLWAHGLAERLLPNSQVHGHPCCGVGSVGNSSPPDKFHSWAQGQSSGQQRQKP